MTSCSANKLLGLLGMHAPIPPLGFGLDEERFPLLKLDLWNWEQPFVDWRTLESPSPPSPAPPPLPPKPPAAAASARGTAVVG